MAHRPRGDAGDDPEVLDVTIGNVALPHMQRRFPSVDEVTCVPHLVSNGIVVPMTGWLDAVGRKRFFMGSTVLSL
jgi:hypothetical protein